MKGRYQAPKGARDILPSESHKWRFVEDAFRAVCRDYGYREIRTPVFEHSDLFTRSLGDTADIVTKETYTFEDRSGRSLTLRPEGTAPIARAYLEHSLGAESDCLKLFYAISIFRYERPQKGRQRQAHQLGLEVIGPESPTADAEIIALTMDFFKRLGLPDDALSLQINSVGDATCRPAYRQALLEYARSKENLLCGLCLDRMEKNPLRLLDCKNPACQEAMADAPAIDPFLCDQCRAKFDEVQARLNDLGVAYRRNHRLVRGLDYYTNTAFEVLGGALGAQNALCGGGRYDGLIEELGGPATPAVGVAIGIERLLIMIEELGVSVSEEPRPDLFIIHMGAAAKAKGFEIASSLRRKGLAVEFDHNDRSLKAQMRLADKSKARFAAILGDDELAAGAITLKNLDANEQESVALAELARRLQR
ncbi:MAG: histidine--tRNA ligase [Armatimonadetes bacterium]|nr:histidine--tRNA ligase [Armatimonadota bacterium]